MVTLASESSAVSSCLTLVRAACCCVSAPFAHGSEVSDGSDDLELVFESNLLRIGKVIALLDTNTARDGIDRVHTFKLLSCEILLSGVC